MTAGDHHRAWQQLPIGSLTDIIGPGTALILAPHPDDESLGCGGLIAACAAAGRPPKVAILTDGAASHLNSPSFPPNRLRSVRAQEAKSALAHLGLGPDRLVFLNQPDAAAPQDGPGFDACVATLQRLLLEDQTCTAILAPWLYDPHCDHEAASLMAAAAAKAANTEAVSARAARVRTDSIRHVAYPVWGWTLPHDATIPAPPATGYRLDITPFRSAKHAAIHAHQSQYGNLINDDPDGFRLPSELLSVFDSPFETFLMPNGRI